MSLRVRGVQIELGGSLVVNDVDLDVTTGQVMSIVGPNGSGKTTLLRAIYRSLRPKVGTVHLTTPRQEADVWTLLAAAYSDALVVLDRGRVAAAGPPQDVLTEALLKQVFGVRAHCGRHPHTGNFHVALHLRAPSPSLLNDSPE